MPRILQAAKWWRTVNSAATMYTGHMFPDHLRDPRAQSICDFIAVPAGEDKPLSDKIRLPPFILYLGYQYAPQTLVSQATATGLKLVYFDVQAAQPAEPAENILYIDPGWPLNDACVNVTGYDVPILPASGVIQAAIYWAIACERDKLNP